MDSIPSSLDGWKQAVNTAVCATPILSLFIVYTIAGAERVSAVKGGFTLAHRAFYGGLVGATGATAWEFVVNSDHDWKIKTEVIAGSAAIGAGVGLFSP